MFDIHFTIGIIKYNITIMGLCSCVYVCKLHQEEKAEAHHTYCGNLRVQGVNAIYIFYWPLWPKEGWGFFSQIFMRGGTTRLLSTEYYQPHLCKHILSEISLAKSHMPQSLL